MFPARLLPALILLVLALFAAPARAEEPKKEDPKKEAPAPKKDAKDPKDMNADEAEAASLCPVKKGPSKLIYHTVVNGKEYHFCTRKCMQEFAADPGKFGVKNDGKK